MDLRDLWSSGNVGREGSSSSDDDGALSVTASLAKEASVLFQSEKFAECVEVLNGLLQKKEGDPKILHNIALAEFVRDGCSDPKKLVEDLIKIKRKSEDLARASREQTEAASQGATKISSGNKGSNILANNSRVVFANEFDASVATLNIGTILFQLHEYSKALSVLEPLFENIEPIDETTALHVCLLLLDVAFVTQDAPKFSDVMSYLEKAFGVGYMPNQVDSGSIGHQQASHLVPKSSSIPNNSSASDDLYSDGAVSGNASDGCLSRMLSDDTMEYETLLSTFDISGKNMSRPSNLLRTSVDRFTPRVNLKLQLPLYKIQLLLLTGNFKAAKREVKLAMNIARGVDSLRTLLLKSQLEYARGNYPKAFKLLLASNNQSDVGSSIIINNNMGCIYHQQGKHNISGVFFHKALSNSSSLLKEKPRKLAQDKSMLIAYNCGVQYLSCGNPTLAAKCFLKASLIFYKRPLLWVRLAECCLLALEKGLLTDSESSTYESVLKIQVIGQGKWRHNALEIDCSWDRNGNKALGSHNKPKLSMSYARACLRNALYLLDNFESKHVESDEPCEAKDSALSKNTGPKDSSSSDLKSKDSGQVSVNGDIKEHRGENQKIKQTVLVELAFVELELGNPLKALPMALSLLELPECSKMYAFLAHIYAAEALCLLNRPKEASEHLFTYLSRERNVELPYTKEDCRQWQVNKAIDGQDLNTPPTDHQHDVFLTPEEARVALYVNLASMHAIQGDLEQAWFFASRALGIAPQNHEAMAMGIYLDLKVGNTKEALAKLKRCHRVRFCPIISR